MPAEVLDPFEVTDDCGVRTTGKRWSHCTLASWDAVRRAADGNACALVWPDEGEFNRAGVWRFNAAHKGFEPLLLDMTTARALVAVHGALKSPDNVAKVERMTAKGRGQFAQLVEFTWSRVKIDGFGSR